MTEVISPDIVITISQSHRNTMYIPHYLKVLNFQPAVTISLHPEPPFFTHRNDTRHFREALHGIGLVGE